MTIHVKVSCPLAYGGLSFFSSVFCVGCFLLFFTEISSTFDPHLYLFQILLKPIIILSSIGIALTLIQYSIGELPEQKRVQGKVE